MKKTIVTKKRTAKLVVTRKQPKHQATPAVEQPVPTSTTKVSKKEQVLSLIQREGGATLSEIMNATGWQKHYADVRIMPMSA